MSPRIPIIYKSAYTHMAGLRVHFLVAEHASYSVTLYVN